MEKGSVAPPSILLFLVFIKEDEWEKGKRFANDYYCLYHDKLHRQFAIIILGFRHHRSRPTLAWSRLTWWTDCALFAHCTVGPSGSIANVNFAGLLSGIFTTSSGLSHIEVFGFVIECSKLKFLPSPPHTLNNQFARIIKLITVLNVLLCGKFTSHKMQQKCHMRTKV